MILFKIQSLSVTQMLPEELCELIQAVAADRSFATAVPALHRELESWASRSSRDQHLAQAAPAPQVCHNEGLRFYIINLLCAYEAR